MKILNVLLVVICLILGMICGVSAELIDRGGGLIYDTELDVTWMRIANYAGVPPDGAMTRQQAVNYVENLEYYDSVRNVIWNDWRMPDAHNPDGSLPVNGIPGSTEGELGHLFLQLSCNRYDSSGMFTNCDPLIGVNAGSQYWTNTSADGINFYVFGPLFREYDITNVGYHPVIVVRDGDVIFINRPPAFNPLPNQTSPEGQLLEFTVSAEDPDENDTLTYSAENLPSGAVFNPATGTFSWTPCYDQAGNYEVTFIVMDSGNPLELDVVTVMITIGNVNRPPAIEPVQPQTVNEGQTLTFAVTAPDPDGDVVDLCASDLPDGAVFNPSTRQFIWTPSYLDGGNYVIVFTALDNGEPPLSSQIETVITVGNTPNPTQLTDDLINTILGLSLPNGIENSYMANLKKVNKFIEQGKINPAVNQVFAFMCKVEEDVAEDLIDVELGDNLLFLATEIVLDLNRDPNERTCD
ncbi:hypothetical protein A2303_07530 [Candidatus Falkowbacteria bacterium RIFOXYB2_FULL_47_14]|uniref:Cadherin domain-containing protein n=1 Tax=Candidatus Falkowbacteria bacterium RIFOXYA2_FULL_47_19 TaxID=1797994 RepID=A0A1F5SGK9_9BACT|nr:MAG: hypothetical protein A2227_01280 [Candidatus Falkowbacteria bacterium RIFOXYA2_FULL_47_19]OGF34994.1 MAG: hypothetical protein A2468_07235 [Candidatus Falkowbacteria bacterium RIFOXYC2_FULL_46_15]OGF43710.1 MAG: hypothetical protein A2303_07530 [Candidatus Falkowbacteria bacterium RIFOXYB2_FULL_47_14]